MEEQDDCPSNEQKRFLEQLPRVDGTLDHRVLLRTLKQVGYEGVASLKCHGTAGWPLQKVTDQLAKSAEYVRECMKDL